MVFWQTLLIETTLTKRDKNSIFLLKFHQKFQSFSQNSPTLCSFRPNARNINDCFANPYEKYAKIMDFPKFSLESFWKISEISQNFTRMSFSSKGAKNFRMGWRIFLGKNLLKLCIFSIFLRNILANFRKLSGVLAPPPRTPYEAGYNLNTHEIYSCLRQCSNVSLTRYRYSHIRKQIRRDP